MKKNTDFDLSALKTVLLKPHSSAIKAHIFGADLYIRRLTAAELIAHEDALIAAQEEDNVKQSSELSVQLILDSLCTPDGEKIQTKDKPSAAELLDVHDNVALLDAISTVKKHAIGTLEAAEKN